MTGPKETAYDDEIHPLVKQILEICGEHGINVGIYFALDETEPGVVLQCRSVVMNDVDDTIGCNTLRRVHTAMTLNTLKDDEPAPNGGGEPN